MTNRDRTKVWNDRTYKWEEIKTPSKQKKDSHSLKTKSSRIESLKPINPLPHTIKPTTR